MVGKHREELKKITAPVEGMIRNVSIAYDSIDKVRKKIRQQGEELNKKIDQHYDRVVHKLMEQKEELKQQVHDTVSQKVKAVRTQLEEVECAQAEVLSMKELNDAVEKSSDQEVLSVKEQVIDHMQQINEKYMRLNLHQVKWESVEFVPTKQPFPQFGFLRSTATPNLNNCKVVDLPKYAIKGKMTEFTVITRDDNGGCCFGHVSVLLDKINDTTQVKDNNDGSYMVSFVSQKIGGIKLSVFVNGQQIKGSPYSVTVKDYTSVKKPRMTVNNDGNMGQPWGIAFGQNGIWAVADCSNHCVRVFDGKNHLVKKFGMHGSSRGLFYYPQGVTFDSDNRLYVADCYNHRIQKFTTDGKFLFHFGSVGSENGKLKYPNGLIVHDGKVYVSDRDNHRISVFKTDGKFHHTIGSGQLGTPFDVTVNGNNQLHVADYHNNCIHTFTLDGNYLRTFGIYGNGRGQLIGPYAVTVDLYGFIFVADTNNHRISIFDKDGNYVHHFGSQKSATGQFSFPYGIAMNADGDIYVSDHINNRIQIF